MTEKIQEIIQRVVAGSRDETDLQAIAAALRAGDVVLATGDSSIAIGGDANDSVNVTGNHNQVTVVKGLEAEVIAKLLQQSSVQTVSVDELLQQVRSRASTKILNLFSQIQLLNKRQVAVDQLYVDVYVLEVREFRATIPRLLEGQDAREQFDRFGLGKRGERSPGLAIAASEDFPRLMVLGKPGSGKSTFLRHLSVSCAKGKFLSDYIPVLLELRDVDEAAFSLFQCLHGELGLEQEAKTEQLLKQGRVLLLLDGLDEVPSSLRQTVQHELRKFAKRYDKNRFILTCRTQTTEYIPEQFKAVEVADFKPEQVECFALHWFTAMAGTPEQGMALKNQFMEKLRESPQTAELAVTPVLLSLTCWIFDDMKGLPQKRSDLYRDGLDLLLQQWDEGRGISRDSGCDRYHQLTTEERKRLLSYVAVRKFEQAENFVLFEESELCRYIAEYLQISVEESRAVLEAISQQHGLLIERAHEIWSFSHLTFQEYLAAKWFCDQPDFWKGFIVHLVDKHWREIFLLAVEMARDTNILLQIMKQHVDHLLIENPEFQEILSWINQRSLSPKTSYKASAIRAFYLSFALRSLLSLSEAAFSRYTYNLDFLFFFSFDLALHNISNSTAFSLACKVCNTRSVDIDRSLDTASDFAEKLARKIDKSFVASSINSKAAINSELNLQLKTLEKQLPNWTDTRDYSQNLKYLSQWWQDNSKAWENHLRNVMAKYHENTPDWQISYKQKNILEQYYYANDVLLDCLNYCGASQKIKNEIEEALLLPIAEIEKRKNQSSD